MVADSCRSRSSVRERASRHGLVSCSREAKASSRRITSRRSGDRNAFWRRQGQALHPERKPLERIDGIRRTLGESTSLLQLIETNTPCNPSPLPGLRIPETRETTEGSAEPRVRIQFPPAKSQANFQFLSGGPTPACPSTTSGSIRSAITCLRNSPTRTALLPPSSRSRASQRYARMTLGSMGIAAPTAGR